MIEAKALTRFYGKVAAVEDVTFSIGNNEIVGLLGHNGAGKTTIMRMLTGYLEPSSGCITVNGVDVARQPHSIQKSLGYLPENLPLYPQMTVAEYLEYAATLKGIARQARPAGVREVLLATDLGRQALDPIHTLSRGSRQRVGVAQAILGQPGLLILDEPTNGLDPGQARHMRQLIRQLARSATIIVSTHIMQEVDDICERVLMVRNGRLALDQSMADLHNSKTLKLCVGASEGSLATSLGRLPQVASLQTLQEGDGRVHFEIQLQSGADANVAANNIAQCVVTAGAELYQLSTLKRDLDSVFREVYRNVE